MFESITEDETANNNTYDKLDVRTFISGGSNSIMTAANKNAAESTANPKKKGFISVSIVYPLS